MREVRIFEHISLDGVIQHGGDEDGGFPYGDWTARYRSPGGAQAVAEAQGERFDFLLGRRTYDLWSSFWPKVKGGPFAHAMNSATKYVATHRPDGLEWGPVGLGRGKRFFTGLVHARELALVGTKATPTGVLLNTCRLIRSLQAAS